MAEEKREVGETIPSKKSVRIDMGGDIPLEHINKGILDVSLPIDERLYLIKEAGRRKATSATPLLIEALKDPNPEVSIAASTSLADMGHLEAIEPLLEAIVKLEKEIISEFALFYENFKKINSIPLLDHKPISEENSGEKIPFDYEKNVIFSFEKLPKDFFGEDGQPLPITEIIKKGLKDSQIEIRRMCAKAASEIKDNDITNFLIDSVSNDSEDEVVRFLALEALRNHISPLVKEIFAKCFLDPNSAIRYCCVHTFDQNPDPDFGECLKNSASDKNEIVRATAISGLGKLKDPKYIEVFFQALKDPEEMVRYFASLSLSVYTDDPAVEKIIDLLNEETGSEKNSLVEILGNIQNKRAIIKLRELIKNSDDQVSFIASMALIKHEDYESLDEIIQENRKKDGQIFGFQKNLETEKEVDEKLTMGESEKLDNMAFELLNKEGALDSKASEEIISSAMKHPNPKVRGAALLELGKRKFSEIPVVIFENLGDKDSYVRSCALSAIGKLADSSVISKISHLSGDESEEVRYSLAKVLGKFETEESFAILKKMINGDFSAEVRRAAKLSLKE
ncbi:MAG: HEAT repeat domain-containing protein [Candidatus Riflebacteria bacterium]|nr:HEAT repeat domain-containing protein [Candidatus Riflebacteria bacterium]